MPNIDRRTLLCAFGSAAQAKTSPCKVSSEDSAGACTVFELNALPRSGPFQHVHHREDEWYYVLSGEFLFRAGGEEYNLLTGGSIWLPRGILTCGRTRLQSTAN